MKTLLIVTTGLQRLGKDELIKLELANEFPRVTLFEKTINADIIDEHFIEKIPKWRRLLFNIFPFFIQQIIHAYFLRKHYDVIVTWSERRAIMFAILLKLSFSKTKHVSLLYWMSKKKQIPLLNFAQSKIDHIITWSSVQRDFAIRRLNIPPEKISFIGHPVDQLFWRKSTSLQNLICAVGSENRDYNTLIEALNGVDVNCHIAAGTIRIVQGNRATRIGIETLGELPPNITTGHKNYTELRDLYAKSKFVVVPLLPSDTDNGINAILEGMSMGKAIICSRTTGQVDVIQEYKTGIFVPPGDPVALKRAIIYLLDNPTIAEEMGKRSREYIVKNHSLDNFVTFVKNIIDKVSTKNN